MGFLERWAKLKRPVATYGPREPAVAFARSAVSVKSSAGAFESSHPDSACFAEPIVERVASAAHGADRIGALPPVERLAQAADMDVHRALVDVDVAAPHPVEQLLPAKAPARPFHQKFEQAEFRRSEINRPA